MRLTAIDHINRHTILPTVRHDPRLLLMSVVVVGDVGGGGGGGGGSGGAGGGSTDIERTMGSDVICQTRSGVFRG